ncbi:E3 ubiquitin-protein ligase Os04g0590900-like, partial [Neltuma alba]|uniref:E3 ubiquitin-protein ligase Os04g0590900-like n=1 Tax=Neltuma alba TaxID=207710 RepID=UPI0010A496B3
MAALGNPKTWIPYVNIRDCSQGFCSVYCPQWCYIVLPPPPPPALDFPQDDDSSPNFSPLVIAIIGILASAFLLVSYYTFMSKYCGNRGRSSDGENLPQNDEIEDNHNPSLHEPWHVQTNGLDEALIKSITVCKYKKGDGLVGVTDCSVCLSEFREDEHIR